MLKKRGFIFFKGDESLGRQKKSSLILLTIRSKEEWIAHLLSYIIV